MRASRAHPCVGDNRHNHPRGAQLNPCAPRCQGEPIQSNGADGDGDDNGGDGGVDDGDQAFTATALTNDGAALAERVPSAMPKNSRKKICGSR
jgi:hypothetical protein